MALTKDFLTISASHLCDTTITNKLQRQPRRCRFSELSTFFCFYLSRRSFTALTSVENSISMTVFFFRSSQIITRVPNKELYLTVTWTKLFGRRITDLETHFGINGAAVGKGASRAKANVIIRIWPGNPRLSRLVFIRRQALVHCPTTITELGQISLSLF